MKHSINQDGKIVFYVGALVSEKEGYHLTLSITSDNDCHEVDLFKASDNFARGKSVEENEIEGIPVLKIRNMMIKNINDLEIVASFAKKQKGVPVSIIDLRNNSGGRAVLAGVWMKSYTGKNLFSGVQKAILVNQAYLYSTNEKDIALEWTSKNMNYSADSFTQNKYDFIEDMKNNDQQNKWYIEKNDSVEYKNKNKIFVLMNKNTYSAAEWFVRDLFSMENVVFIGTNTSGTQITGNPVQTVDKVANFYTLPKTKISVSIPTSIHYPFIAKDGEGYMPDIWLNGNDVLERTIRFIVQNNLK